MPHTPRLRIIGRDDLNREGMRLGTLVRQMLALDHRVYATAIHGHIGTPTQWESVFRRHPQTWRALVDASGALLGYWQIASLKNGQFTRAKAGLLNPSDLRHEDYSGLDAPGIHNLYFASVCIDPSHRTLPVQWALIGSFFGVADHLANKGVFFGDVAAISHSEQGRQICLAFGLRPDGQAMAGGENFVGRFEWILDRFRAPLERRAPRLLSLYAAPARRSAAFSPGGVAEAFRSTNEKAGARERAG